MNSHLERVIAEKMFSGILAVAFSPDGKTVAASDAHGSSVMLFRTDPPEQIDKFTAGAGWVQRVAFSPDGLTLAWSTSQHLTHLRDVPGKRTLRTLRGHQTEAHGLAWAPDGKTLATADYNGMLKLWDPATGNERLALRISGPIQSLAFTRDGKAILTGQGANQVGLGGGQSATNPAAAILSGQGANQVGLWQLIPRCDWASYPAAQGFSGVAVSPDGRLLAAAPRERELSLRVLATQAEKKYPLGEVVGKAVAFAPVPDAQGRLLLAIGAQAFQANDKPLKGEGHCQLWDAGAAQKLATLEGSGKAVFAVAFTPDARALITGDGTGEIHLYTPPGGSNPILLGRHRGAVLALAVSPDGKTLASGGEDRVIRLWDLGKRGECGQLKGHQAAVTGVAFFRQGRSLASTGHDRSVRAWDLEKNEAEQPWPDQPDRILGMAFDSGGHTLALGCQDRTVKLLDVPSRQLRAVLTGHTREVNGVAFSPDGKWLISAAAPNSNWWVKGGELKLWKAGD